MSDEHKEREGCPIERFIDVGRNQNGEIIYQGRITDTERDKILSAWNTRTPDTSAVHKAHCNQGEYEGCCKYGQDDFCPAISDTSAVELVRELEAAYREGFSDARDGWVGERNPSQYIDSWWHDSETKTKAEQWLKKQGE